MPASTPTPTPIMIDTAIHTGAIAAGIGETASTIRARTIPMPIPISAPSSVVSKPLVTTMRTSARGSAPSAARMPSSRERCMTA